MRKTLLAMAILSAGGAASAAPPVLPPEPSAHPDWAKGAEQAVQILRNTAFDPDSLKIEWVSGFKWGYRKPVIGKRSFGWLACGNYNAKNRLGGYVGSAGFDVLYTETGEVSVFQYGDGVTTCTRGAAPVNPELLAATRSSDTVPAFSAADELAKLADLRSRGIITEAEFAALKAKILAR